MNKISKVLVVMILGTTLTANATAPTPIAKVEIPSLDKTADNLSGFSKNISRTLPALISGGMMVMKLHKRYKMLDMNKPIRGGFFPGTELQKPQWCFSAGKKKDTKSNYLKLGGKKLKYKENNKRFIMSESKEFLNTIDTLESPAAKSSDLSLEAMPKSYLDQFPDHFKEIKKEALDELSKGKSKNEIAQLTNKINELEQLLRETKDVRLALSADDDHLILNFELEPARATLLQNKISRFSDQSLELDLSNSKMQKEGGALDILAKSVDVFLKVLAPDKDVDVFTTLMKGSKGKLAFKNNMAVLQMKISHEAIESFIPLRYRIL